MIHIENYVVERGGFRMEIPDLTFEGRKNFIIGKNGSGKTTLLQSLAGLVDSSGVFEVGGENRGEYPPEQRGIGYIPQDLLLFGKMTVRANLMSPVRYGKGDVSIYSELVDRMGLVSLLSKKANEISMGETQKVAIARAIISKPSVLLMDEPFSFQDEIARLGMISLIDELSEKYGFDYIYATHNSRDLELGFSNLVSIDRGRVIEAVDSLSKVEHFRTMSLLDYKNLAIVDGKYYFLNEDSLKFSDQTGDEYEIVGNEPEKYVRLKIGGNYFFVSISKETSGKYVKLDLNNATEIDY
jgi:ABC-type sugar transport system ATPase subunit